MIKMMAEETMTLLKMISMNRKLKGSNRNLKKGSLLKLLKKLPRLLFLRCL